MTHQLAILGSVPPPYGGIAVHVERLIPHLERAEIDFVVYNTTGPTRRPGSIVSVARRKMSWFLRYLLTGREPVVYVLSVKWTAWAGTYVLSRWRGKKVILSMQGDPLLVTLDSSNFLVRKLILNALHAASRLVVASPHLYDHLMTFGDFREKTSIIHAFIPSARRSGDESSVSPEIRRFCAEHSPVILATGGPVLRRDGTDLYGIDMTIDLVDRLRSSFPRVGVIWSLIDVVGSDSVYADLMRTRVMQRSLERHWLFSLPQETFYPVYGLADILVRPTVTDGDALTVREALEVGVPTVASDAAPRPEGTRIFPTRDQAAFETTVRTALENLTAERQRLQNLPSDTAVDAEIALLKEVIAEADACEGTST